MRLMPGFRHQHFALHRGVCVGRAGAAAHQHTEQDVHLRKAALGMACQGVREGHELVAHPGVVHDGTCHDEERDRQQREGLRGGDKFLKQQVGLGGRVHKAEVVQCTGHQRVGNGDAGEVQHQGDDNRKIHDHISSVPPFSRRTSFLRLQCSEPASRSPSGRSRSAAPRTDS